MKSCSISRMLNITCASRHSDTERPKMESVPKSLSPYPKNVIVVLSRGTMVVFVETSGV